MSRIWRKAARGLAEGVGQVAQVNWQAQLEEAKELKRQAFAIQNTQMQQDFSREQADLDRTFRSEQATNSAAAADARLERQLEAQANAERRTRSYNRQDARVAAELGSSQRGAEPPSAAQIKALQEVANNLDLDDATRATAARQLTTLMERVVNPPDPRQRQRNAAPESVTRGQPAAPSSYSGILGLLASQNPSLPGPVSSQAPTTTAPPSASPGLASPEIPQVSSESEYQRLPPGSRYMAPDGTIRVKN